MRFRVLVSKVGKVKISARFMTSSWVHGKCVRTCTLVVVVMMMMMIICFINLILRENE